MNFPTGYSLMFRLFDPLGRRTKVRERNRKNNSKRRQRLQFESLEARAMFATLGGDVGASGYYASATTDGTLNSASLVNTYDIDLAIQAGLAHLQNILDRDNNDIPFFAVWALTKDQARSYGDSSPYRDSPAHMAFDRHLVSNVAGRAIYALLLGADAVGSEINPQVLDALKSTVLKSLHKPRNGNWSDTSAANQMITGLAADPRSYGSTQFDLTFLFNMGAGMRGALGLGTLGDNPNAILDGYNWSGKTLFDVAVYNIRKYYVYGGGEIGGTRTYNWESFRSALGLQGGDKIAGSVSGDKISNWSNLYRGWSDPFLVYDLVKYYEATGHQPALELAKELRDNAFYARFPLTPSQSLINSFTHMFEIVGEMNAYSRLALVTGDADMMQRVRARYEALRGIGFNTTGWVPEFFGRESDVGEINCTGELVETALNFAAWGWTEYYEEAERFVRGQMLPAQLLDTSFVVPNANPDNDGERDIVNRVYGAFGFPAPYGHVATKDPSTTGGYHVDITAGAVASLAEVRKAAYTYTGGEHQINLLFDVDNATIKVDGPYPNGDRVTITTRSTGDVRLRLPSWADRNAVSSSLEGQGLQFELGSDFVLIHQPTVGTSFDVALPLKVEWTSDVVNDRAITIVWKGDSVLAMSPMGTPFPFFLDPNDVGGPDPEPGGDPLPNQAPQVEVGSDRNVWFGVPTSLDATVSDDGLPTDQGSLTVLWSQISGPGTATFGSNNTVDTTVSFSLPGQYVLRLQASDGALTSSDDITINVADASATWTMSFQDGVFPTIDYSGTRDTHIQETRTRSGAPTDTNFGTNASLDIDGSPDIAALMAWDVSQIPEGSRILSASIDFNVLNATSDEYEVYALERAWDELAASWQSAASGNNWSANGANGSGDYGSIALAQLAPRQKGHYTMPLNEAGLALVQAWIDDPSSNLGLIIKDYSSASDKVSLSSSEAATPSLRPKLTITYAAEATTPPVNQPPQVQAGADQTIQLPSGAQLNGTVSDDGLPNSGNVNRTWSVVSGPGSVTFANPGDSSTLAQFGAAGQYILRLTASDGSLTSSDDVSITVLPAAVPQMPPTVSAGADQSVQLPNGVSLFGSVTTNQAVPTTARWTLTTGPAAVTFANSASANTTVQFTTAGTYVLRLTGTAGTALSYDEVTITVTPAPIVYTRPSVYAGPDQTIDLPNGAALSSSVTLSPAAPEGATALWTLTTGPAAVNFANSASANTSVHFTTAGTYVLRLTITDGRSLGYDEVTITVNPEPVANSDGWSRLGTRRRR